MRTLTFSVIGAILLTITGSGPVAATPCSNLTDTETMKKWYEYALIAEAPKRSDFTYMKNCVTSEGITKAEKPDDIVDIVVPEEFAALVVSRVDNNRLKLQHTQRNGDDDISPFSVGCKAETDEQPILVELGFKLLAQIINERVVFYLTGTELQGGIIDRNTGERIVVSQGTIPWKPAQVRANFEGEQCLFPFVKETVDVFCEVIHSSRESRNEDIQQVHAEFVRTNGDEFFSDQMKTLTMIGHSLGGSATQYVALNLPDHCMPDGNLEAFNAYAIFASPGLEHLTCASVSRNVPNVYLINGDWFLNTVFPDRRQNGQITVFSYENSEQSWPGHFIEEVQNTICGCLKGQGALSYMDGNMRNRDILTAELC